MDQIGAIAETVRQVREQLAVIVGASLSAATDTELCALTVAVEDAGRLLDGLRVATAGEIGDRSRYGLGNDALPVRFGLKRASQVVERLTRVAPAEAARRVSVGTAVRPRTHLDGSPLPPAHAPLAVAMSEGGVGIDAAAVIVRCLDQARSTATDDDIEVAEVALVETAARCTADEVGIQARAWREALDPDGAEPRDERIYRKRSFLLGREVDGLTKFSGVLTPVDAALLAAAFNEADKPGNAPRFLSDVDRATGTTLVTDETGETTIEFVDPRSREQRHYDVVTGLLGAGVRSTGAEQGGMRSKAEVTAIITLDDLRSGHGVGFLDGTDEPVSAATVQQLVCANGYAPILLGDNGEVLMLGQTQRLFSPAQVRALRVRDGGCVNCGAPPGWCDAHHVDQWARDDGPTDIDNGVLLCQDCHRLIHRNAFAMKMIGGRPHILAPPWLDPEQKWRRLGGARTQMITSLQKRIG
ncbi:HNH endonuclease signature motif containing protein [Conyzicola nivalis]|uniref:HNH endonuclease n=1 Tax=Conyzicola nivalis TaxID=1477021 RepID=A0A916SGG6_9MICO|nr:HNH endonuclease signature motif containing protein [Conyzicola nivalis]GGA99020.1 HNH endonuclease [Conyzicola nivalis]